MKNRIWMFMGLLAALAVTFACGDDSADDDGGRDVTDARDVVDEGTTCGTGELFCDGACVNVQSRSDHCGACDTVCAANELCRAGVCELDCPISPDYDDCGGTECSSLLSDPENCGACGTACGATEVCSCGACVDACGDLNTDADNCGACGNACGSGEQCCCGACTTDTTCPDPCPMVAVPALLECGADGRACVDVRGDLYHCGDCEGECDITQACGDGVCTTEICTGTDVYCLGHCTNLMSSSQNCGRCGNACDPTTEYCFDGRCVRG
ncbi:MAG: hypothetical protein HY825_19865 [Acidobacteria bacterium]|nr:hypothetical protein [Acidobacteriota bacterium]